MTNTLTPDLQKELRKKKSSIEIDQLEASVLQTMLSHTGLAAKFLMEQVKTGGSGPIAIDMPGEVLTDIVRDFMKLIDTGFYDKYQDFFHLNGWCTDPNCTYRKDAPKN